MARRLTSTLTVGSHHLGGGNVPVSTHVRRIARFLRQNNHVLPHAITFSFDENGRVVEALLWAEDL